MKKTKTISFVQSVMLLPVVSVLMPFGNISNMDINMNQPQIVLSAQTTPAVDPTLKLEADAIDSYFKSHNMPLEGQGMKMAQEADANDIDWRLLPAIAARESTGGRDACDKVPHNFFGWGSCKIGFSSDEEAIETVANNLGGNNPVTAKHYDNKTTLQILHAYNPPSIVPHYAQQVMKIMDTIGPADIAPATINANA